MTCRELWELASDYLDGDADESTAAQVRRHAARCARCRAELKAVAEALTTSRDAATERDLARMARAARALRAELE